MRLWRVRSLLVAVGLALVAGAGTGPVAAQGLEGTAPIESTFPINDADPESSIPAPEEAARDPVQMGHLVIAITNRAEEALVQGQPSRAAKYFRALARAAPDRALPFRKACAAHKSAKEVASAIKMCREALGKVDATPDDRLDFLDVALMKQGALTPAELGDIDKAVAHLQRELGHDERADKARRGLAEVKCQVAARLRDATRLRACTEELRSLDTDVARLLPYAWALAMSQGDLDKAASVKDEAIRAGAPTHAIELMERGLAEAREERHVPVLSAVTRWWPAGLVLALVLGAIVVFKRKRRAASNLRPEA